ncbi:hypothetical protein [Desulfocucumis palustris]|nr:hypothetical protein [Desulfocucumis palustris]
MNELELARRFSEDIDKILKDGRAGITPPEGAREDYAEAIELARELAVLDLTGECGTAGGLRRRLLEKLGGNKGAETGREDSGLDDDELDDGELDDDELDDGELDDGELDRVAGGINQHRDRPPEE